MPLSAPPPPPPPTIVLTASPREQPIHRGTAAPADAFASGKPCVFAGEARPGEFYVFQVGVCARERVGPLRMRFSTLKSASGSIPSGALRCISLGGIGPDGKRFGKSVSAEAGIVTPLWVGVDVPADARGDYAGTLTVASDTPAARASLKLLLTVAGDPVADHGAGSAASLARLRWLDSAAGEGPAPTAPFTPVTVWGRRIGVVGREIEVGADGLVAGILSRFSPSNTRVLDTGRQVLAAPMRFVVETASGPVSLRPAGARVRHTATGARWTSRLDGGGLRVDVTGAMDFTGSGEVRLRVTALEALDAADMRLEVPYREDAARFFMGLNKQGGVRPASHSWRWNTEKRQDCWWMGDVNAGLMLRLKDAAYVRPPVNIYYHFRPLKLPASWGNGGAGSVSFEAPSRGVVTVSASSGLRKLARGETLDFVFEFYATPFRCIDTEKQWSVRFAHLGGMDRKPIDRTIDTADPVHGPNVVNVHHASLFSPFINYPYADASFPLLQDLVKRAHARGVRLRIYYTTREITHNMPELLPLHSLDGEVILPGPGKDAKTLLHPNGPHPWLVENLREDFVPAWVAEIGAPYGKLDLSVITNPDSRWNNYYIEGLRWLVDKADIDGVYIDDTALDAGSLQRARRILDSRPGRLIDFHTWNHYNEWAGWASNLNIYAELLPYIDRLWIGEGFSAKDAAWDFWLVEMSGLPFGLMSEMLDGPTPWKGMLYGETARQAYSGDNTAMWKVWDEFGIQGSEMAGFYAADCPVRTDNPDVRATVYRKPGRVLVALGSWAKEPASVRLQVDWAKLGIDPAKARLHAPAMSGMQDEHTWSPGEAIPIEPCKGWMLVLEAGQR